MGDSGLDWRGLVVVRLCGSGSAATTERQQGVGVAVLRGAEVAVTSAELWEIRRRKNRGACEVGEEQTRGTPSLFNHVPKGEVGSSGTAEPHGVAAYLLVSQSETGHKKGHKVQQIPRCDLVI